MTAQAEGQCGDSVWWFFSGDTLVLYGTGETWLYGLSYSDIQGWAREEYEAGHVVMGYPEYSEYAASIRRLLVLPGVDFLRDGIAIRLTMLEEVDLGTVSSCWCNFSSRALKEITFPESMVSIGSWMFQWSSVEKVTILNGSTEIGEYFFCGCTSLREVWFGGNEKIEHPLFSNMNMNETDVTFYVKPGSDAEQYAMKNNISYEYY